MQNREMYTEQQGILGTFDKTKIDFEERTPKFFYRTKINNVSWK